MARQNYSHGKRLREMAKKQKREEKAQRRLEKKNNPNEQGQTDTAGPEHPPEPEPQSS